MKVMSPVPGVKLVVPPKVKGLLKTKLTAALVKLCTFCTSSGWVKVMVPEPLAVMIVLGALMVIAGKPPPEDGTGKVTVRALLPEMSSVALPPPKPGSIVTGPRASIVPVPPLL